VLIDVEPGIHLNCQVDDYLWPWQSGTPVLMMHGYARNASFWNRWVPFVARERRIYRPELRGCGDSWIPPEGYRYDTATIANDLVTVFDRLGLERVHWVGESSGGILGLLMAATHPQRIASLVLCNTPYRHADETKSTYSLGAASAPAAILRDGVEVWCRATFAHRLDTERSTKDLDEWYIGEMSKTPKHAAAAIMECFDGVNTAPLLSSIQAPALLLSGDRSTIASQHQAQLQHDLPNAELRLFEGYGHGINLLVPERCAAEAIAFWDRVEG
jgi:3-oxoadipate enol-lactonase